MSPCVGIGPGGSLADQISSAGPRGHVAGLKQADSTNPCGKLGCTMSLFVLGVGGWWTGRVEGELDVDAGCGLSWTNQTRAAATTSTRCPDAHFDRWVADQKQQKCQHPWNITITISAPTCFKPQRFFIMDQSLTPPVYVSGHLVINVCGSALEALITLAPSRDKHQRWRTCMCSRRTLTTPMETAGAQDPQYQINHLTNHIHKQPEHMGAIKIHTCIAESLNIALM